MSEEQTNAGPSDETSKKHPEKSGDPDALEQKDTEPLQAEEDDGSEALEHGGGGTG